MPNCYLHSENYVPTVKLWGKAQNYLEASLSIEPSRAAHLAPAQLFEKLEKHDEAADHYHKGLGFSLKKQQA